MRKIEKKYWAKVLALGLVLVLSVSSMLTTQAAKKVKSKSISLGATKVTLSVGDIATLQANMKPINSTDTIKWSSSDKKVASVNKYGVVTALKEGNVTITAKTSSKKTAKCKVTVKESLTAEEVTELIESKCLSEESVKNLIKNNTLSEADVLALIKQNSIDEMTVKKLIVENSLSEEEVEEIIGEYSGSIGNNWEDGTELKMLSNQSLPVSGEGITITKISVKKEHYDGEWNGVPQKYKYVLEIEGTVPEHPGDIEDYWAYFGLRFLRNDGAATEAHKYQLLESINDNNIKTVYSETDGKFVITVEQYNIFSDYDEYMISDFSFGYCDC